MKKIIFIVFIVSHFSYSQGFRALTRQGERAYKDQDYATSTINAVKALQQDQKFKKSIELFEKSIVRVNKWYEMKIEQLESNTIPYKDLSSVSNMKVIIGYLQSLNNVQNELMFFPEKVKLSNKNLVSENTKSYKEKLNESKKRLKEYNLLAAQELYDRASNIFKTAQSKSDYQEAYKIYDRIKGYVRGFENVGELMRVCVEKGSYRVALLDPANSSGRSDTRFRVINTVMNQIRGSIGNNLFAIPVNISNYSIGYYSNNYSGTGADVVIKITFNDWNYGSSRTREQNYSNQKKRTKKDGTEQVFNVSGKIVENRYVATFDAIVEAISTSDNTIIYSSPLNLEYDDTDCYLIGSGQDRANDSGCTLVSKLPEPPNMENVFKNEFIGQTNSVLSRWFN